MNPTALHLALIGDYDPQVTAHQAIPLALQQASAQLGLTIHAQWLATDTLLDAQSLQPFDGFWCVPASPYRDIDGALRAIRFAREQRRPSAHAAVFNMPCWNMRAMCWAGPMPNMANWPRCAPCGDRPLGMRPGRDHRPVTPNGIHTDCRSYGTLEIQEAYRCRYGVNHDFEQALLEDNLIGSAHDSTGEVRAIELLDHPFLSPRCSSQNARHSREPTCRWSRHGSGPARSARHDCPDTRHALLRRDLHLPARRHRSRLRTGRRTHARTGPPATGVSVSSRPGAKRGWELPCPTGPARPPSWPGNNTPSTAKCASKVGPPGTQPFTHGYARWSGLTPSTPCSCRAELAIGVPL